MATFKLLAGKHVDRDSNGNRRVFKAGDIFDSDQDLLKLNTPGAMKFEQVATGSGRRRASSTPEEPRATTARQQEAAGHTSAAPGGQESTGFPVAGHGVESGVGGIKQAAPQTVGERTGPQTVQRAGEMVPANAPPKMRRTPSDSELHAMKVEDLKQYADDEEIDLKGAKTKEDIIKAIKGK